MLLFLDAASLWYRSYHAVPSSVTAPDGRRSGALRGFFDGISTLWHRFSPTGLVCCLEGNWRPQWRVDLVNSYKAQRTAEDGSEDSPEGLDEQVAAIEQLLAAWGLATAAHPEYEADDVLATLAVRANDDVAIATGDRDLFQLVDDHYGISVIYMGGGLAKAKRFDEAAVMEKYGIPPSLYRDFAVLRGDASDGLPGVTGIGDKGAATLLHRFGDLATLQAAAHDSDSSLTARQRTGLVAAEEYLPAAAAVSTAVKNVDIPEVDPAVPSQPIQPVAVRALIEQWGIGNVTDRCADTLGIARP